MNVNAVLQHLILMEEDNVLLRVIKTQKGQVALPLKLQNILFKNESFIFVVNVEKIFGYMLKSFSNANNINSPVGLK